MAVGLSDEGDGLSRIGIPSGGAGTLSGGGFTDFFVGVWVYRPTAGNSYGLTSEGAVIYGKAGAREIKLGFDNTFGAGTAADPQLQMIFNSGGGAGSVQTFADQPPLDEWVFFFVLDNATDGMIVGWAALSDLATPHTITRANDNAGSQYINELYMGNRSTFDGVLFGHYAFGRAVNAAGIDVADALAYAADSATVAGDWGFWPLADNTDTGDDSGNARSLTFTGTLTSESSPTLGGGGASALLLQLLQQLG